jgi:hypothetical protein
MYKKIVEWLQTQVQILPAFYFRWSWNQEPMLLVETRTGAYSGKWLVIYAYRLYFALYLYNPYHLHFHTVKRDSEGD